MLVSLNKKKTETKQKSCQWQSQNNSDFGSITIHGSYPFSETNFRYFSRTQINFSRTFVCIYKLHVPWNEAIYKIIEWQPISGKWPSCIIIFRKFSQILYWISIILFDLSIKLHRRTFLHEDFKIVTTEISFVTNLMVF